MTTRRRFSLGLLLVLAALATITYAQNPVSISQVGTTPVSTTVPVSGTVAATESGTWTVQPGNTANTTAWKVDGSAVTQPVSGTVTANLGTLNGAATSAKQDTGNTSLASIDGKITAVNTGAVVVSSSALPALAATSTKQSDGSQKTQVVDGSGNVIGATSNALDINIKSGNPTSIAATESGTWTVQPGNTANSTAWLVQPVAGTANGTSTCYLSATASTNATNCKNAAGLLYGIEAINTTSTLYYVRLYNLSSAPTCNSATGYIRSIPIPHASGNGGGLTSTYTVGQTYGTGLGFCLTGGGSSTDNTNAATGVYLSLDYK